MLEPLLVEFPLPLAVVVGFVHGRDFKREEPIRLPTSPSSC